RRYVTAKCGSLINVAAWNVNIATVSSALGSPTLLGKSHASGKRKSVTPPTSRNSMSCAPRALGREAVAWPSNVTPAPVMRATLSRPASAPEPERHHLALERVAVDAERASRLAQVVVVRGERVADRLALGPMRHLREQLDRARRAVRRGLLRRAPLG